MAATIDTTTVARGSARLNANADKLPPPGRVDQSNRATRLSELGNIRKSAQRARQIATTGSTIDAQLNPREILKLIQGDANRAAEIASKDLRRDAIESLLATVEMKPVT